MEDRAGFFPEIVYLRAIAILAVISIHVSAIFIDMKKLSFLTFFYMSIDAFSHFAVPLFVAISGFVLFNKYQGSYDVKKFFKKRMTGVLPQYTFFTLVAFLATYFMSILRGTAWNFSFSTAIYQYLTGTAYFHLWFFVLIIELYILYPVSEKIFMFVSEKQKIPVFLFFLLIIQIAYTYFSIENKPLIGPASLFLGYMFYFVLGMVIRSRYPEYRKRVKSVEYPHLLFVALLPVTILETGFYRVSVFSNDLTSQFVHFYKLFCWVMDPVYFILIFIVCFYVAFAIPEVLPGIVAKSMKIIGNYSFGIFLVHAFIVTGLTLLLFKIGFTGYNWLFFPVVFTLVLGLSLIVVNIINRIPYHEYIIGSSR